MAMRQTDSYEPLEGEIIYPIQTIPYTPPVEKIPEPPHTKVERTGLMGLQADTLDTESKRRLKELYHPAREIAYRRIVANQLKVGSHQVVTQAMNHIEAHHNSLPIGSLAQKVSGDIAAGFASHEVAGVLEDAELYAQISSNTILKRR